MQISVTEHATQISVYINGAIDHVENYEQVGKTLQKAGVKPDNPVNWMNQRGVTDRLMASQFLPTTPVKKGKANGSATK